MDPALELLPPVRQYRPFGAPPFQVEMGLRKLDPADWIQVDRQMPAQLALKAELLHRRREQVLVTTAGALPGSREVLALLAEHLPQRFPDIYRLESGRPHNRLIGEARSVTGSGMHPLEAAARLVQEDLCLMTWDRETGGYHLGAACVCFPSRWDVREKLGQGVNRIHRPVPHYGRNLARPMDRLFDRLSPQRPVWRLGWSVTDSPQLFQPPDFPRSPHGVTAQNAGERIWLRAERQTLRRLPKSRDILFTIRVYVYRLDELVQHREGARHLITAFRELDPALRVYKEVEPVVPAILGWLSAWTAGSHGERHRDEIQHPSQ